MAASWTFGSVSIYVRDFKTDVDVKRAEIIPLDAVTSTYHMFGSSGSHYAITGLVIGNANRNQLLSDAQNNVSRTLTTPWETVASAKINGKPEFEAIMYAGADIDGTSYGVNTTPLYIVTLDIIA